MKTAALSFFVVSVILAALLAACFNPITVVPPQGGDAVTDPSAPIPGEANGTGAGIPNTGAFTVTIPVNPEPGGAAGRAADAELDSTAIKLGGVRNTFLLVVLDTETGEVAESLEADKWNEDEDSVTKSVTLPTGKDYGFLLLMGHRERDYGNESNGVYKYKAGPPTLLAAGFTEQKTEQKIEGSTTVTITMYPLTVTAEFIASGESKGADAKGVSLTAAKDWKLTWTVAKDGLKQLKDAQWPRRTRTGAISSGPSAARRGRPADPLRAFQATPGLMTVRTGRVR